MKCTYCEETFNNMEIGRSHEAACKKNPANKGLSDEQLYKKAQEYRFRAERWKDNQGVERKKCFINLVLDAVDNEIIETALLIGSADTAEQNILKQGGIEHITAIDLNAHCPNIIKMDMHEMKFKNESFDLVIASHSLEHSFNFVAAMREIARVLKPGGFFAAEIPVNYTVNDVDRHDFLDADFFISACEDALPEYVISPKRLQTIKLGEKNNFCGTDVVKAVMRIYK